MNFKDFINKLFVLILFIGLVIAFLPHATHIEIGLAEESHLEHIIQGFGTAIIALLILIWNNNSLKSSNKIKNKK